MTLPTQSSERSGTGKLRQKQVLVVVLAIGLGIALLTQPESEPEFAEASPIPPATPISPPPSTIEPQKNVASNLVFEPSLSEPLPRIELSDITSIELFQPDAPREEIARSIPVLAVYGSSANRAALVGEKTFVRTGQSLPRIGQVIELGADGIRIKP
ncbi:MAG: hypothetical protein ACR2NZ_20090 [Rubripirellula sp.]